MTFSADSLAPGSTGFLLLCLLAFLLFVNLVSYATFGIDKRNAVDGAWRVPEGRLLLLALLGGWAGAKLAQRRFRHKTRKQPFGLMLNGIGLLYVVLGLLMFSPLGAMLKDSLASQDWTLDALAGSFAGEAPEEERVLPRRFGPGS